MLRKLFGKRFLRLSLLGFFTLFFCFSSTSFGANPALITPESLSNAYKNYVVPAEPVPLPAISSEELISAYKNYITQAPVPAAPVPLALPTITAPNAFSFSPSSLLAAAVEPIKTSSLISAYKNYITKASNISPGILISAYKSYIVKPIAQVPPPAPAPVARVAAPIVSSSALSTTLRNIINAPIPDSVYVSLAGPQGPPGLQGIQGVAGPAGPRGPAGSSNFNTSNFVSQTHFNNQVDRIYDSIEDAVEGINESIGEEVNTETLAVSGNATIGGDLTVTGTCTGCGGGATTPGGLDTQVQFNDGGAFGGDAGFTYDDATDTVTLGALNLSGLTASRLVFTNGTNLLVSTGDSAAVSSSVSDETGSGALVFANSPVFTTPNIGSATGSISGNAGTATSLAANGTNCAAGLGALGVDASGAAEGCTDFEEDLVNSAGLAAALSDETGTGLAVFNNAPTLISPIITTSPTAAGATWTDLGSVTTIDINGGTIDGTVIGGASPAAGTFTTISATSFGSTGDITITKADPALILNTITANDTDFWLSVTEDTEGDDDDFFQIGDGTTPGMNPHLTIDTSGNVGIGTVVPGGRLHVYDSSAGTPLVVASFENAAATRQGVGLDFLVDFDGTVGNDGAVGRIYGRADANNYGEGRITIQSREGGGAFLDTLSVKNGNVGIGTTDPEALLEVQGAEGTDAVIALDADDGDDNADTWFIKSLESGNALSVLNHTTEVFNLSTVGALQIDAGLTMDGHLIFTTDNTYDIGASGATRPRTGYFGTSVVAPSFVGALTGNATTATSLAANGANCAAGSGALGVDASGAAEGCTDFEEDLVNSAGLAAALSDETGTGLAVFNNSPTFADDFDLAAAGIRMTGADGALTLLGLGDGNDENLIIDFDNAAANTISVSSSTGVTSIDFGSIAISAPATALSGNLTITKADPSIILNTTTATDTDFWLGVQEDAGGDDDDTFQIGDGTTPGTNPFLTINTSGNVGIGTISPLAKVHIIGSTIQSGLLSFRAQTADPTWRTSEIAPIDYGGSFAGGLAFYTHPSAGAATAPTERMRIDEAGEVGIGSAFPEALLEVQGAEATDAVIALDADDGDDAADTWFIKSLASGNALSVLNHTTEVFNLTIAGALQIDSGLTLDGHQIFTTDNTYDIGASGATRPRTGYFGTSLVAPTINATTAYQLNGTSINTGGTLTNVAYLDQANIFTANQTISKADPVLILDDTTGSSTDYQIRNGAFANGTFDIYDGTNTASRFSIDSNGQIGVGAAPVTEARIYVLGNVGNGANVDLRAANATTPAIIEVQAHDYDTSFQSVYLEYIGSGVAGNIMDSIPNADVGALVFQASANSVIKNTASVPLIFGTDNTERLRITGAGLVGIGTTGPATTLDINGVTTFRGNIIAGTDNTYDIGASGATRPRTGYFGTSVVAPSFVGAVTGNATTATALAANGANCAAGSGALGVDASGAAEGCTDFEEDLVNSAGLAAALSDETGTGLAVFNSGPTLISPIITTSPTAAGATWTDLGSVTTIDINGGTIDGTVIGGASPAAGTFTTLSSSSLASTGNLTITKDDASIILADANSDTDFWLGVQEDAGNDDDDTFQIGDGTTPGTNPFFIINTSGNLGLTGTTPTDSSVIRYDKTFALTADNPYYGINSAIKNARTSTDFEHYTIGLVAHNAVAAANTQNWIGDGGVHIPLVGVWGQVDIEAGSTGTISEAASLNAVASFAGATLTNWYGLHVKDATIFNPGSLTNAYGVYIQEIDSGSGLNYALYSAGGNNYFGGNVGIGTSPGSLLHVAGTAPVINLDRLSGTSNNYIQFSQAGVAAGYVGIAGAANGIITGSVSGDLALRSVNKNILFSTNDGTTAHMYIENGGDVGIGTITPEALLEVQGAEATDAVIALDADDGDDTTDTWFIKSLASGNALSVLNHTTEVFNLSTAGALQIDSGMTMDGHLIFTTDNTYDIGASGATRPRTGYFGTSVVAPTINATTAYQLNGTSINTAGTLTNVAYLNQANVFTANQTITKDDASLILSDANGDTDFWLGVQEDAGNDDDDTFQIGDGTTPGTNPFLTINTSGNVGIGTTAPAVDLHLARDTDSQFRISAASNTASVASYLSLEHYRGTHASPTANSASDSLGIINFIGHTDTRVSAASIRGFASTGWGATGSDSPGHLTFLTTPDGSGTLSERMRIDSTGNVGIGVTDPSAAKLVIDAASNTTGIRLLGTGETTEIADIYMGAAGELILSTTAGADASQYIYLLPEDNDYGVLIGDGTGATSLYTNFYMNNAATDYLNITVNAANSTTGLVIQQGGNVGIGIVAPLGGLHVYQGASGMTPYTGGGTPTLVLEDDITTMQFLTGTNSESRIWFGDGATSTDGLITYDHDATATNDLLTFRVGGVTDILTIKGNGFVGIGTNAPVNPLHVTKSVAGDWSGKIINTNTTDGFGLFVQGDNNPAIYLLGLYDGSTYKFVVEGGGDTGIGIVDPLFRLHVVTPTSNTNYVANFVSDGNDVLARGINVQAGTDAGTGTNIAMSFADGDGTAQGDITFTSGTVTYGAFTANHDVSLPESANASGYPYGTLVCIDGTSTASEAIRGIKYAGSKCDEPYAKNVLGAYAGKYDMKPNLHQVYVLGDGQILVNGENGDIKIGDPIVTSSTPGIGMKGTKAGMAIGYAQEDYNFSSESQVKLLAVQYGLVDNQISRADAEAVSAIFEELGLNLDGGPDPLDLENESLATLFFDNLFTKVSEWLADAGNGITGIFTEKVTTDELCVGDVCVTEAEFLQIVQQANAGGGSGDSGDEEDPPADDEGGDEDEENTDEEPGDEDEPPAEEPPADDGSGDESGEDGGDEEPGDDESSSEDSGDESSDEGSEDSGSEGEEDSSGDESSEEE